MTSLKRAAFVVGSLGLVAGSASAADGNRAADCTPTRVEKLIPAAQAKAPPLPFRYIGRIVEDGKIEVLLLRGEHQFSVAAGDMLGTDYRVEAVNDQEVVLRYLPLDVRQRLPR